MLDRLTGTGDSVSALIDAAAVVTYGLARAAGCCAHRAAGRVSGVANRSGGVVRVLLHAVRRASCTACSSHNSNADVPM